MDHFQGGLKLYWVLTSAVVLIARVGVANLYVHGGLKLRHTAWFTLFLGVYDLAFTRVIPLAPLPRSPCRDGPSIRLSASPPAARTPTWGRRPPRVLHVHGGRL